MQILIVFVYKVVQAAFFIPKNKSCVKMLVQIPNDFILLYTLQSGHFFGLVKILAETFQVIYKSSTLLFIILSDM